MMMAQEFQKKNMKTFLNHSIKLTKAEETLNQVWGLECQLRQIL